MNNGHSITPTIKLNVNGQEVRIPLDVFTGAMFESLSQIQKQWILDRCAEIIRQAHEQVQKPKLYIPQ